ncbi:hypothetical protein ABH939_004303 [Rhodococcus sp. 27YEA6]
MHQLRAVRTLPPSVEQNRLQWSLNSSRLSNRICVWPYRVLTFHSALPDGYSSRPESPGQVVIAANRSPRGETTSDPWFDHAGLVSSGTVDNLADRPLGPVIVYVSICRVGGMVHGCYLPARHGFRACHEIYRRAAGCRIARCPSPSTRNSRPSFHVKPGRCGASVPTWNRRGLRFRIRWAGLARVLLSPSSCSLLSGLWSTERCGRLIMWMV